LKGWRTVVGENVFSGSALGAVGADGAVPLPRFILRVLDGTAKGTGRIVVGAHESDPCLTAWETSHAPLLHAEVKRRRLRDEAQGAPPSEHHARARRLFGFAEDVEIERGRLMLPPMLRSKGRIGALALLVGTGSGFEIWSAELAAQADDPALREIAAFRLGEVKFNEGG
jgi:DNA-binding transcriptional regulator/RsmH inhibitor MraZ